MYQVLLLSAYDGVSHRYWRESLGQYLVDLDTDLQVTSVSLPARYFSWRQRGNSLAFARHPDLQQSFDLVIATSVTDLAALRGMNRNIASAPVVVYFHENQFAYPDAHQQGLLERQLTSIYTAISGDHLLFNSDWNRQSFMAGASSLLGKMPDQVPRGVVSSLQEKSSILPVALPSLEPPVNVQRDLPRIVWNHRWEHDKGPERLRQIVEQLVEQGLDFSMSLLGQRFSKKPGALLEVARLLADTGRLGLCEYLDDRDVYLDALGRHNLVLSTADQEFQGLAVQEAILSGCTPIVPDALAYPEYVPAPLRYRDVDEAVTLLTSMPTMAVDLKRYSWQAIGPQWLAVVKQQLRLQ